MTTWKDLKVYIRNNYKVSEETDTSVRMLFETSNMRSQWVLVFRAELRGGEEWFSIESPIGRLDELDLALALTKVGDMVCGALATLGNLVVLRHSALIADLAIDEFERPLLLVLNSADKLEKELTGGDRL